MNQKLLAARLLLQADQTVEHALDCDYAGADEIVLFDLSGTDAEHEESFNTIREIKRRVDIPLTGLGNIQRGEDVKKFLYAGCSRVLLNAAKPESFALLKEVSDRFGKEKIGLTVKDPSNYQENRESIETYASVLYLYPEAVSVIGKTSLPTVLFNDETDDASLCALLEKEGVAGLCGEAFSAGESILPLKKDMKEKGIPVNTFESSMDFSEFRTGADGLIPIVVQDYKNLEVLMVAYMNREAFDETIRTGRMTYYSRSRQELWVKGLTSGHFQYVRKLSVDCDNDTLLAQVAQVGAACHTGNRSCFYRDLLKKDTLHANPSKVFEDVYAVIEDRKKHPKEGSYTNYLFEKGIDKILKKVGEEATEIVIAAKNPNPEEIKYEIADFLYHVMVLMSERGVTWDDITEELANR